MSMPIIERGIVHPDMARKPSIEDRLTALEEFLTPQMRKLLVELVDPVRHELEP